MIDTAGKRQRLSLTARLTLLFAAASTTVLLTLGLLIAQAVEGHFIEQDMELLHGKIHLASHLLARQRLPADLPALRRHVDDSLVGHHGLAMAIVDQRGDILFATPEEPFPAAMLRHFPAPGEAAPRLQTWDSDGRPWRGLATRLPAEESGAAPVLVAVAVDISHHRQFMQGFQQTLWTVVALAAALVGILGWLAVRRGLAPLRTMRQGAAGVTASRLDFRLRVDAVPAELAELAATLNDMLARLEESFQRLQDFSSDLAHELRTPISNLMTQTQVALTRARRPEAYREVLASNAEEYERLARMIGDMLFLAQADNGRLVPRRAAVDLAMQVGELFDFFDALAEEKMLRLTRCGAGEVRGDKSMLRRALANLLSNAIRHTPARGWIEVRIATVGEEVTVAIENSGPPIAAEHLPRLFDRFYRADPSRHGGGEGAGLGLAISRSIIRAHGGEIEVHCGDDAVCFLLRLPRPASATPARSAGPS
ncbi:MAG TPA: heavy metal sensor histidine kinase [Accumulibacter sp.]|jgi:two-component system heavy metal sensor histidine kinase CusS|nr:heavy metal sensor histidine kinase [Accumulibacter sp.]HQC79748.1 heavy metal sensor histidine kinase [Accumulibacter sp.]